MAKRRTTKHYSCLRPPSLAMSELICKTLDHDATDVLIDRWLEHRNDAYWDWFKSLRERKHAHHVLNKEKGSEELRDSKDGTKTGWLNSQALMWVKGEFVPENVFCRTVDTGRLIPLDRTWTTHVYFHRTMQEKKRSMMPVVFTMLPELMLLRGMHDHGCDEMYIIVTDMKRKEMDDVTEYFKLVCRHTFGRTPKPSVERQIQHEHTRLTHTLHTQRRTPCFPQIDLTFRGLLHSKKPKPPFIVLFSHHATSYSQIFFTHPLYVPSPELFHDFPTGCPNPNCKEDCELVRFPRKGIDGAAVLEVGNGKKGRRNKVRVREMCNWIDCGVVFEEVMLRWTLEESGASSSGGGNSGATSSVSGSEGSQCSAEEVRENESKVAKNTGQLCSRCKLVKYCSPEHQRFDWEEHKRVCVKPSSG